MYPPWPHQELHNRNLTTKLESLSLSLSLLLSFLHAGYEAIPGEPRTTSGFNLSLSLLCLSFFRSGYGEGEIPSSGRHCPARVGPDWLLQPLVAPVYQEIIGAFSTIYYDVIFPGVLELCHR